MLAIAALLRAVRLRHSLPFVFIGNVGEEGEGDLRGMRHIYSTPRWKDSIAYSVVLDGAGADTIVAEALGSRRFEVIVRGPGGHSWSDFGAPNPIVILARAIDTFTSTPGACFAEDYFQYWSDSRRDFGEFDSRVGEHEGGYPVDFDGGDGAVGADFAAGAESRGGRRDAWRRRCAPRCRNGLRE
jgi:acetylornithine deacetylase/succinyl-diaminopimelate desuccinylase-like protein